ncbi:MAG TPA: four helix bundle protein [Bellilinea sp.]|nr:four helix bundle protein [Bellilinea sp.]
MITQLALYQKTYDLYHYTHLFVKQFPKSERFLVSLGLQSALLEAIRFMVQANNRPDIADRRRLQEEAEARYTIYATHLRLARDLNLLPKAKYEHASLLLEEIERILGGWKKCQGLAGRE